MGKRINKVLMCLMHKACSRAVNSCESGSIPEGTAIIAGIAQSGRALA